MPPLKISAVLLHLQPYRETSAILRLYGLETGLVHGVARGVRGAKSRTAFERGMILETTVYGKAHQSLHTLGSVAPLSYFSAIRTDLFLGALRDAALEVVMRLVHPGEASEQLYELLLAYLDRLDHSRRDEVFPYAFWRFCIELSTHLGFAPRLDQCVLCGGELGPGDAGCLEAARGGLLCMRCAAGVSPRTSLPPAVVHYLRDPLAPSAPLRPLQPEHLARITRLLVWYCCHHADVAPSLHAVDFVCSIAGGAPDPVRL